MSTDAIEVRMWDQRVGAVAADPRLGAYVFEYDPKWVREGIELAPLTMPLNRRRPSLRFRSSQPPSTASPVCWQTPSPMILVMPSSTPGWPNAVSPKMPSRPSIDCPIWANGAWERWSFIRSVGGTTESAKPLEMKSLVEAARKLLKGDFSDDAHAQAALANIIRVGTSAGGARPKAVIAWNPETEEIRSGQFDVAPGLNTGC